jgi:hypothetical protein
MGDGISQGQKTPFAESWVDAACAENVAMTLRGWTFRQENMQFLCFKYITLRLHIVFWHGLCVVIP